MSRFSDSDDEESGFLNVPSSVVDIGGIRGYSMIGWRAGGKSVRSLLQGMCAMRSCSSSVEAMQLMISAMIALKMQSQYGSPARDPVAVLTTSGKPSVDHHVPA